MNWYLWFTVYYHTGDGVCVYLSDENLCTIYDMRPDICNVDRMYQKVYKNIMPRELYYMMNIICKGVSC